MTKKFLIIATVLLVHTAAAHAQQSAAVPDGASPAAEAFPPAYAPPPGYQGPAQPAQPAQPYYGPGPTYGAPPAYAPPPTYAPQGYGPPPGRYPPPNYYYRYPPPPPRQVTDRPFTLGGGIGFGGLSWKDVYGNSESHGGMGYTFHLGFGLHPGLILMWDVEGTLINQNGGSISQTANLAALQIFATQRLFVKAGFGIAELKVYDLRPDWAGAAMAGIGYELIQGWNWSFDIQATVTGARYNYNPGNATWTNWSLVNFAINFF